MSDCIFCKIINKKAPARIIYEDEECLAFEDVNPQAPNHFLVIPKEHIATVLDAEERILGKLTSVGSDLAEKTGIATNGFRIVINCNRYAGQTVYHLHLHVLGGRWLTWPPG